jgi:hypothetical protein
MAELSLNARNMKMVGLSIIGIFSLFGFFMVVLFGKYLVKLESSKKFDMDAWLGSLSMITIGTLLSFMTVMAMS